MKAVIAAGLIAALATPAFAAPPAVNPNDELKAISRDLLEPAADNGNKAVALAASNPEEACRLAQSAAALMTTARKRMDVLAARKDIDGVEQLVPLQTATAARADRFEYAAKIVCNGEFARAMADPVSQQLATHIGPTLRAYNEDMMTVENAEGNGDTKTFCTSLSDAKRQLAAITASLADLRKTLNLNADDIASLDRMDDRIADFTTKVRLKSQKCPAG